MKIIRLISYVGMQRLIEHWLRHDYRGRHLIQFTYTSHSNTKEMVETRGFHLSRRVVNDEKRDDVEMREGEER